MENLLFNPEVIKGAAAQLPLLIVMWYMLKELTRKIDENTRKTDSGNEEINELRVLLAADKSPIEIKAISTRLDDLRDRIVVLESTTHRKEKP